MVGKNNLAPYLENPGECTEEPLTPTSESEKVIGYKSTQHLGAFSTSAIANYNISEEEIPNSHLQPKL